ncbi:hypothetical protein [Silvanigrella aquatica]|uniref:hypothetical protein n=1 Tax=Silvanigrella aquatica TaxID=1915309 RepID=UPI0011E58F99|nr:hypothetical protein [Silvanigrella aquatica]
MYIKKDFFKITFFIFVFILLEGCSKKVTAPGPPYSAHVIQMNSMQPSQNYSDAPTYNFQTGTFTWLQNLDQLDGNYFKFIFGGVLTANYVSGSLVSAKSFSQSKSLNLRYKVINGVVVPKDYSTMAMLFSYYQLDTIANNIQTMTGYSMDTIKQKYGKINIFFEPKIELVNDGSTIEASTKLNAAYAPGAHQFIMYQRSTLENVPLAANLQVVAHEFGHSIWELAFDGGQAPDCDRLNLEYAIRGLNEGFADMHSYTLTGSTNVLQNSINIENIPSQRNFSAITFKYDDISGGKADADSNSGNPCTQSFYCIGTLFANALFNAQANNTSPTYVQNSLTGTTGRGAFMTMITTALQATKAGMLNSGNLPDPSTIKFTDFCRPSPGDSNNSTYNGRILGTFFNSFLKQIPLGATRTQICKQLEDNFGTTGFQLT